MASTAAASVLPGGDAVGIAISYSMLRRWGFTVEQVTVGSAATTVWNSFANVIFSVAAVVFLAIGGESHPLLTTAAVIGRLRSPSPSPCSQWHSTPTTTRASSAVRRAALEPHCAPAPPQAGGQLGRATRRLPARGDRPAAEPVARPDHHHARRPPHRLPRPARGVASRRRAAHGCERGRGVRGLGPDPGHHDDPDHAGRHRRRGARPDGALVSFGGQRAEVVAAVLLYRVLTYVPPIAIGGVCLMFWRRLPVRHVEPEPEPRLPESHGAVVRAPDRERERETERREDSGRCLRARTPRASSCRRASSGSRRPRMRGRMRRCAARPCRTSA